MSGISLSNAYPIGEKWDPVLLNGLLSTVLMDSITGTEIAGETITATNLATDSVETNKIKAGAITTIKLDANSVTADKIQVDTLSAVSVNTGTITVTGTGAYIRSSTFAAGPLGAGFNMNLAGEAEFQNVRIRGKISGASFEQDVISSVGGTLLVIGSDILNADMTALDNSTLTILGDTTFAVNDVLRIKDGVDDEWLLVTNIGSAPTYTVTRDQGTDYTADNNPIWTKGTTVVNYGAVAINGLDSDVKLLLHLDGADAATTTTDASDSGHVATFVASAQLDTAQKKFGTSSLLLNGSTDYITFPDHADWNFGSGDFTIDFWIKSTQATGALVCGQLNNAGGDLSFYFYLNLTANKITFRVQDTSGHSVTSTTSVNDGAWHHITGVRYNDEMKLYINGVSEGTPIGSLGTVPNRSTLLAIGRGGEYNGLYYDGWVDEFRISKGVARWTANFTIPTVAYFLDTNPGGIVLTASESNSPRIDIFTHDGTPWNSVTNHVRLGNLNNFLDYTTDLHGLGIGTTDKFLAYDTKNSLRIQGNITVTGVNGYIKIYDDSTVEAVRLGNLNGFLGYSSNEFGIAIGESTKYLKYDSTNGLRLQADEIKLLAGTDIIMVGDDSDPSKIVFQGTDHTCRIELDTSGDNQTWEPETASTTDLLLGSTSNPWDKCYLIGTNQIAIRSILSGSQRADFYMYSTSTYGDMQWTLQDNSAFKILRFYYDDGTSAYFAPTTNKTIDLGLSGTAWDDVYADDYNNEADFVLLDVYDDLQVIKNIKPSGETDPRSGLPLINDDTLPNWLLTKHKNKGEKLNEEGQVVQTWNKGDTERSLEGKPYLSLKTMISLCMGAIKQLSNQIEDLKKQDDLYN